MNYNKMDLYCSIESCDFKMTKKIMESNFKLDSKTGEWAMYLALKNQNSVAESMLIKKGAVIRKAGVKLALSHTFKIS